MKKEERMNTDNPLLDTTGLPRFDAIRPEHITPAMDALLADAGRALELATSSARRLRRALGRARCGH